MCFYCTVIRPIIEYASPVWHSSLTVSQSDVLESLQKRAMNVIFPGYDYKTALINGGVDTLRSRREELTRRFFVRRAERDILSSLLAATKARREHYHET